MFAVNIRRTAWHFVHHRNHYACYLTFASRSQLHIYWHVWAHWSKETLCTKIQAQSSTSSSQAWSQICPHICVRVRVFVRVRVCVFVCLSRPKKYFARKSGCGTHCLCISSNCQLAFICWIVFQIDRHSTQVLAKLRSIGHIHWQVDGVGQYECRLRLSGLTSYQQRHSQASVLGSY